MRILGTTIAPSAGNPRLLGAVVSGSVQNPVLHEAFELRATDPNPGEQAVDLARLLRAKLPGLAFERGAIRVAGTPPVARRLKAQFSRAHAEGAVLYVLREYSGMAVEVGDPTSFSKAAGISKDALIAAAKSLSASKFEAVIAAIGCLPPN